MKESFIDDSGYAAGFGGMVARLVKWGGALVSVLLILATVVWAYRLGVRDARDVPVIQAMQGPARTQPEDPGGSQAAHQGLDVNDVLAGAVEETEETIVLAPEAEGVSDEDLVAGLEEAVPEETNPLAGDGNSSQSVTEEQSIEEAVAGLLREVESEEAADAAPATQLEASARPTARPNNLPRPRTTPAPSEPAGPATAEVNQAALGVVPGSRLVQLGAFDSEAAAEGEWDRITKANLDLLGDKSRYIEEATSGGRQFFRLRAVGFASLEQARAMCEALKARGVDCIPVTQR